MSLNSLIRFPSRGRQDPMPTHRRRPSSLRLFVVGLEDRLVLSHATAAVAPLHAAAQIHTPASNATPTLSVPITVTAIKVTTVTRDPANGVLSVAGSLTGTILGQTFTTAMTGTATPAKNARSLPALNLNLQPIDLGLLGLHVKTGVVRLSVTGGNGGLLRSGLSGAAASAAGGSTPQAMTQLNALLNNPQSLNALNRTFGQAQARLTSFTPAQGTVGAVLNLSLSAVRLNQTGMTVRLDNGNNGAVTVNVSAAKGQGLLGDMESGLTGGTTGRALTRQIGGVFQQITNTPVPSAAALMAAAPPTTAAVALADPTLITLDLKPLDVNLLGLEVKTSEIIVTVSAQPGSGKLLGNLLTTVVNLQGVNNALNNVLGNVVTLANSASLNVTGVLPGGPLGTTTSTADVPVLTAHVAPVHLDLLGAVVDTSPIDVSIVAHPGSGKVLGNVIAGLANLLNTPPKNGKIDVPYLTSQIHTLNTQLAAITPSIPAAPSPPHTVPAGTTNVLSLNVAPINLNLLGLVLPTDQIQVNADAQSGNGNLLGNLLTDLLNTLDGTPANLTALNGEVNNLLAKVVGVLNATNLVLPAGAVAALSQTLQTLALPNLVNTTGAPATAPVLDLNIASQSSAAPPIDVNLLGLLVTTSDVHANLSATTGDGQVLGNLVYNLSHLLDPGGSLGLLTILNVLGL